MLGRYLSPEALAFGAFRLGLALAVLLAFALLWRRPRPRAALVVVAGMHLVAWLFYRAPLQRPYGVGEGSDRTFNLGMAASTAAGHSPFEHTQVGHGSPEPLWNAVVAVLSGMEPQRVPAAYDLLTPLAILALAAATYAWARAGDGGEDDRWRGVLAAFSVLSLSSLAMSVRPPVPPFWVANVMYKPHHGLGYALAAAALAFGAVRLRPVALALALGALAWVSLVLWGYVLVALLAAALVRRETAAGWRRLGLALAVAAAVAAPYVWHLARDYAPMKAGATARHMWNDPNALLLAVPNWSTLDLGALLTGGLAGLGLAWRDRGPLGSALLGFGIAGWGIWLLSVPMAVLGVAPEPDEMHYFLRYVMSLASALALGVAAERLGQAPGLGGGRGALLVMAACLPLAFPVYHDPPTRDRYYPESLQPVPPKVAAYAEWIRASTRQDAVFVAGKGAAMFIPAFTGRRVLLAEAGKLLPSDYDQRKADERTLLLSGDEAAARAAAARYGITHVAVDEDLMHAYGGEGFDALARAPWHRTVFANTAARLVELRWTRAATRAE